MKRIEFELNVPSGSMVFSDSLPGFQIFGSFDINSEDGLIKQTMAMARIGCAHGYVGNSCPGVYRLDDKTLAVASISFDDDMNKPKNVPGEFLGQIVTDLWWYSFADAEEYERRGGTKEDEYKRIAVRPGVYKFSHTLPSRQNDDELLHIYATITWIRDNDPVKDYLKEFRESNFTAEQVIRHKLKQWPSLYCGEDAVMKAADHIFCVIGGDGDWHPNGFVQYDPDMSKETAERMIPTFNKPFRWYPLCEYSALVKAANGEIYLNSSFAALAKNIARCIVTHGSIDNPQNQATAEECLKKLEDMYPDRQ